MRLRDLIAEQQRLAPPLFGIAPSITRADLGRVLDMATELAAHASFIPQEYAWWTAAVGGEDGTDYTLAELAREAGIDRTSLARGRLTTAEGLRATAIVARERDRAYGTLLAWARRELEPTLAMLTSASASGLDYGTMLDTVTAQAATLATASGPLRCVEPPGDDPGEPLAPESVGLAPRLVHHRSRKPLRCSGCGGVWTPRKPRPRQCPRCQRYLDWGEPPPMVTAVPDA